MARIRFNRMFVAGLLAPVAAVVSYIIVYQVLTTASHNLNGDWLFRLSAATVAMLLPSVFVFVLAARQRRRAPLTALSKLGIAIALLTLGLAARPVTDGVLRSKQERNMAMHDVAAPLFETADVDGHLFRLSEQKGKVVLVNRWATWCGPCLVEMPELDGLYRDRKDQGLVVFGLSDQEIGIQKKFLQKTSVTYPMLTMSDGVPGFYRDVARFKASFLIDRNGMLHPIADTSSTGIRNAVDLLLASGVH
ncbi:TlpA disulfide reductase family protein [Occallatibacter savannae]|uniref:TlpA disulfide reductase family protein n=1 Tax=Occallatibacter savannae TaxID=1002691 RepID=UPI000D69AAB0|nr:TlpA disulfide reductase family protein [Occallatibacter savannae]